MSKKKMLILINILIPISVLALHFYTSRVESNESLPLAPIISKLGFILMFLLAAVDLIYGLTLLFTCTSEEESLNTTEKAQDLDESNVLKVLKADGDEDAGENVLLSILATISSLTILHHMFHHHD